MIVRAMKGNDFQKGDPCPACRAPRRRLFSASRGGGKGSRLQHSAWRKCSNGHRTAK